MQHTENNNRTGYMTALTTLRSAKLVYCTKLDRKKFNENTTKEGRHALTSHISVQPELWKKRQHTRVQ